MTGLTRAILRRLRPYRRDALLLGLLLVVQIAFENGFPLSLKFLIDDAIVPRDETRLALILVIVVVAAVLYAVAGFLADRLYATIGTGVLNDVRRDMFGHLQRLPLTTFTRLRSGDVTSRFSGDLAAFESALVMSLPGAVIAGAGVLVSFSILFTLQWQLTLIAVVGLPLAAAVPVVVNRRAEAAAYDMRNEQGRVGDAVHEAVSGQVVVKAFGLRGRVMDDFERRLGDLHTVSVRANFLAYLMERTPNLAVVVVQIAVLGVGAALAIDGTITVGTLVSFNGVLLAVSQAVYGLTWALPDLVRATAGHRRIEDLLAEAPETGGDHEGIVTGGIERGIEIRDVSFEHEPGERILDGVGVTIPRGAFVALVGGSGSGKSTLLNLLLRFGEPVQGALRVDGRDLRELTLDSWRAHIGVVLQETFLFDIPIGENVRLARPDATDAEVEEACRRAGIHDVIVGLRDGYATLAGERGGRLSGGQRQRLAIARAILREPDLLLLDEPTSALDPLTEEQVNATLREVSRGRTTVCATHRLAAVTSADLIVVMERGRAVEQGTHEELLALDGRYRALFEKQSGFVVGTAATVDPARLRDVPLLAGLDAERLEEIAALLEAHTLDPGTELFAQGDRADALYLVARGRVEVSQDGEAIAVLDDGDHLGEIALLEDVPRSATARALDPTTLLVLQRDAFMGLLERHPGVRASIEASVRERLARDAERRRSGRPGA